MFANMKVGTKILVAMLGATLALVAVGIVAWSTESTLTEHVDNLGARKIPTFEALETVEQGQLSAARDLYFALIRRVDPSERREALAGLKKNLAGIDEGIVAYEKIHHGAKTLELWAKFKSNLSGWRSALQDSAAALEEKNNLLAGGKDEKDAGVIAADGRAWAAAGKARELRKAVGESFDAVWEKTKVDAHEAMAAAEKSGHTANVVIISMVVAVALTLVLVSIFLARGIGKVLGTLAVEAGRMAEAVAAGKLDVRADESSVAAEFRPIVAGLNSTMVAVEKPVRFTVDMVGRIGKGDIPPKSTERFEGDFDLIKQSLNACIEAVNGLVADATMLARAGVEGRLATRADAAKHQGDFRRVVQGVNETLDAVVGPLNVAARYVDDISKGKIPEKISAEYRGDFNAIKANLNQCIDAVNLLVADAGQLAQAGVDGRLSTRADATRHQGDFRKVVEGVNKTLDAVVGPLNVAAKTVDDIARGEIPPRITETYRGDFNAIKDNLNTCIDAVNRLVADANTLAEAAVAGRLTTRADVAKHQGDFRRVVEGVNKTLDAVLAPINEAAGVLERLSQRDLRARVKGEYQGDHARIKESLNATGEALHDAIAQVSAAVDQVSSAATQIAASSQAVAAGASEQASSLQETSASIESVSALTRQSADSAQQANGLAGNARGAAGEGAAAVEQMQGAMGRIKASAEGTSQIIKDINDIAFQTNLLALNAAVEAARAGEAGRGFAVVAEEVRSLALRAKEAATKTEDLIRQSVKEANEGEATSRHVVAKLGEITQGIGKVTDIVQEMAAAAKEQATGIDQVNKAVSEMDKVTQQNAASAEESSSAASELSGQAEELAAMVGSFQLTKERSAPAAQVKQVFARKTKAPALPPARGGNAGHHADPAAGAKGDEAFPMDDKGESFRDF